MKPSLITTNRPGPGPSPGIRPQSNVITKPVGASINCENQHRNKTHFSTTSSCPTQQHHPFERSNA